MWVCFFSPASEPPPIFQNTTPAELAHWLRASLVAIVMVVFKFVTILMVIRTGDKS